MADPLAGLTDHQCEAVVHTTRDALLVIGGPGSGKTEVLIRRLLRAVDDGAEAHRMLFLSAQEDLRERVERALAKRPHEDLALYAFPDFCIALLGAEGRHAGIDPFIDVVSPAERLAMLLDRGDDLELSHHDFRGRPLALFASFIRRIDALKAELIDHRAYAAWARARDDPGGDREREFATVFAAHDAMLEARGVFDEGGVLQSAVTLLQTDAEVAARTAARYPHALVDDWQNRSRAERALVGALEAAGTTLSAAGDDDQALARSPGAGAGNMLGFTSERRNARVITLTESLRCPQVMLDAAHAVVQGAGPRLGKELRGGQGGEVHFWRAANERAQAQRVAAELERLIDRESAKPEACAVLVRNVAEEGQAVAVALAERGVACRLLGADAFFDRAEVRDVLAWLRLLLDPRDASAVVRALARPPIELPSADVARVVQISRRRKIDMVSALHAATESPQLAPEARERIGRLLRDPARRRRGL